MIFRKNPVCKSSFCNQKIYDLSAFKNDGFNFQLFPFISRRLFHHHRVFHDSIQSARGDSLCPVLRDGPGFLQHIEQTLHNVNKIDDELSNTFLAWCRNPFSAGKVAQELSIHRNTLQYRLKKIKESWGLDPWNFHDCFTLWSALILKKREQIKYESNIKLGDGASLPSAQPSGFSRKLFWLAGLLWGGVLLLAILEDIGYMARVAFVMDRIFRHFGLSGKSFIPMLVATGCGIPGLMASRTISSSYSHT